MTIDEITKGAERIDLDELMEAVARWVAGDRARWAMLEQHVLGVTNDDENNIGRGDGDSDGSGPEARVQPADERRGPPRRVP